MPYKKNSSGQLQRYDPLTGKYLDEIFDPEKDSYSNLIAIELGGDMNEFPVKFPDESDSIDYMYKYIDLFRKKTRASISEKKLGYLLDINKKGQFFRIICGFNERNVDILKLQLLNEMDKYSFDIFKIDKHGIRFNVKMLIDDTFGFKRIITIGWIIRKDNSISLVTAF